MATIEIRKKNINNIWTHTSQQGKVIFISKGHFRTSGDSFELTEPTGSDNVRGLLSEVELYNEVGAGSKEVFPTMIGLINRLQALEYPYFFDTAAGGVATTANGLKSVTIESERFAWFPKTTNTTGLPELGDPAQGRIDNYWYELSFISGDSALLLSWNEIQKQQLS